MNDVDRLVEALRQQLLHPWTPDKSGGERVWFLVHDPDRTRAVLARKEAFRQATEAAGKRWVEIDISDEFGRWMAGHRYAARYYAKPRLATTIAADFAAALVEDITRRVSELGVDDQTLLAITGTESLYGITKLSHLTKMIEDAIPGRLLVFFPGEFTEPHYRFLNARDGWSYLAIPIVPVSGRGTA